MDLTPEVAGKLGKFGEALKSAEESVNKLTEIGEEKYSSLSSLEKAEHDLTSVYTILSLYWGLLKTRGIDPKQYEVKKDFDRVQEGLKKVNELRDKAKAPHVDKGAAERFVRSALWEAKTGENENEPAKKRSKTIDGSL